MHSPQLDSNVLASEERYRTLLEINNAIITNLTQENLLHAISKALRRVIPFDRAAFTLYVPERDRFRFLAIEGVVGSTHFRVGLEFSRADSISAWVFDQQRPALSHDLQKEQRYPNDRQLLAEGLNSYCVVPLIIGGKSVGTLNLASEKTNQYSDADAELLCEVGGQVALAVSNMTSFEEIAALNIRVKHTAERYRTLLEINNALITQLTRETLLRSVLEILRRVVSLNGAAIAIYHPANETFSYFLMETTLSSEHFRAGVEFDRKDSISSWVCDHQCAVMRGDLENEQQYPNDRIAVAAGIHSDCIVPLIVGGKSIGTLNIGSGEKNEYSEADLELLQETGQSSRLGRREYAVLRRNRRIEVQAGEREHLSPGRDSHRT